MNRVAAFLLLILFGPAWLVYSGIKSFSAHELNGHNRFVAACELSFYVLLTVASLVVTYPFLLIKSACYDLLIGGVPQLKEALIKRGTAFGGSTPDHQNMVNAMAVNASVVVAVLTLVAVVATITVLTGGLSLPFVLTPVVAFASAASLPSMGAAAAVLGAMAFGLMVLPAIIWSSVVGIEKGVPKKVAPKTGEPKTDEPKKEEPKQQEKSLSKITYTPLRKAMTPISTKKRDVVLPGSVKDRRYWWGQ